MTDSDAGVRPAPKILIVGDDPDLRRLVSMALEELGITLGQGYCVGRPMPVG